MLLNFACKVAYGLACVYACGYVPILLLSFCHYRLRVLVMGCLMLLASSILTPCSDTQQSRGYPLRVRGHVNLSATHTHTFTHYIHTHYLIYSCHDDLHIMYITMYSLCTHATHYEHYMYTICTLYMYTLSTHYLHYVYVFIIACSPARRSCQLEVDVLFLFPLSDAVFWSWADVDIPLVPTFPIH